MAEQYPEKKPSKSFLRDPALTWKVAAVFVSLWLMHIYFDASNEKCVATGLAALATAIMAIAVTIGAVETKSVR